MTLIQQALDELRSKACELREVFGDDIRARSIEWAVGRMEVALARESNEPLSLAEAAQLSGYSQEHLARLVRRGRIPNRRPPGSKGRILISRSDLPQRPMKAHTQDADVHELASRLFRGKEGRHGHP
jgi:hypothetical protein